MLLTMYTMHDLFIDAFAQRFVSIWKAYTNKKIATTNLYTATIVLCCACCLSLKSFFNFWEVELKRTEWVEFVCAPKTIDMLHMRSICANIWYVKLSGALCALQQQNHHHHHRRHTHQQQQPAVFSIVIILYTHFTRRSVCWC